MVLLRCVSVALLASGLVACSNDSTTPEPQPATLAFLTQPAGALAGAELAPVTVRIVDAGGSVAAGSSLNVTLAISAGSGAIGATLPGTVTRAAVNGAATFDDLVIQRAASGYTLTATASGLPMATSTTFAISAGAPHHLKVVQTAQNVTAGQPLAPGVVVQVEDAFDNVANSAPAAVTLALSAGSGTAGARLGGTLTQSTGSTGRASFDDLAIDRSGMAYSLTASAGRPHRRDYAGIRRSRFRPHRERRAANRHLRIRAGLLHRGGSAGPHRDATRVRPRHLVGQPYRYATDASCAASSRSAAMST
jgi:hypothetical protein